jgi:hypothetical protein
VEMKVKIQIKTNRLYEYMALAAIYIGSNKLAKYFSIKWLRSTKCKIGAGPWEYVNKEATFEWE